MKTPSGLYLPNGEFIQFADAADMEAQVATRATAALGQFFYGGWLPNPDPVLKKMGLDVQVYKDLRTDAHVGGCIRRRKASVHSLESGLDREGEKNRISKSIEGILADLDMERIIGQMHDAVLFGYAPMEILWGRVANMTVPVDVIGKPPEWFSFGMDNQLLFRSRSAPMGEAVDPVKFICVQQDPTYDNPYGFPDLSMCFWPTTFKKAGYGFWAKFIEKYGMPWPIGKYPRGTPSHDIDGLLDKLESMVQDGVAAIPNDASVEFLKVDGSQSSDSYHQFLMFCRSEVAMALLGQNQSTEANSTRASAVSGLEVTGYIRDGDAKLIAGNISRLIKLIVEQNWSNQVAPKFDFWEQEEIDTTRSSRDKTIVEAGARLTKVYFQRAYGLADDEVDITQAEPSQPAPPLAKFAGIDAAAFPDQTALDDALDSLFNSGELQGESEALLKPVFAALEGMEDEDAIMAALLRAYPDMDATRLVKTMTRLYFAAETVGQLSALAELAA